jgi:pimeloyl-ACP methyl ester carboxylesterase
MSASVVFIQGLCPTELDYKPLMDYEFNFYKNKLPAGTPLHVDRWDHDVAANVLAKFPTGDLVIVGFSFGGQKAVEICTTLNRPIKKLILLDPVDYHNGNKPNTVGFVLPDTVKSAHCFYRGATQIPWSGSISKATCEFINKKYNPTKKSVDEAHGEMVWHADTISLIKASL